MKKNKLRYLIKRGCAFLVDLALISLIITIFGMVVKTDLKEVNVKINNLNEKVLKEEVNIVDHFKEYSKLVKEKDELRIKDTFLMINATLVIFILVPYFRKRTIGMQIMKLEFNNNPSIIRLILRSIIPTGIVVSLIGLLLLLTPYYFILITIITLIQLTLALISLNMIIYRKDNCGLQDKISNLNIVEI